MAKKGPIHRCTKFLLMAIALLAFGVSGCGFIPRWKPEHVELAGGRVELPLVMNVRPYVVLPGESRGTGNLLLIDTGTWNVILSEENARNLRGQKHPIVPHPSQDVAGYWDWRSSASHIDSLELGGARFRNFDAHIQPIRMFSNTSDMAGGLLGLDFFRDCLMTLDIPRGRLILETGELPAADGKTILNARRTVTGSLLVEVLIAGKPFWAKIDSGCYEFCLSDDIAAQIPFEGEVRAGRGFLGTNDKWAASRTGTIKGSLTLGQHVFPRPVAKIGGRSGRILIGVEILSRFSMTVDQKNNRVRFLPADAGRSAPVLPVPPAPGRNP